MVIERACRAARLELAGQRCVVQGFGNVGGIAASELRRARRDRDRGLRHLRRRPRPEAGSTSPALHALRRRARLARGLRPRRADHERGAARASVRRPRRSPRARTSSRRERRARPREADRRGRERPDDARGRRDPRRARHPGPARHPRERRRRHRLVLRVGAGSRPAVLGPRRDPRASSPTRWATRSTASGRCREEKHITLRQRGAGRRRSARSPARSRRAGSTRETSQTVRDAMVPEPTTLDAPATRAGGGPAARRSPEVRAVLVCDDGALVGVVTRKTLVREVVAAGLDPAATPAAARSPSRRSSRSTRSCRSTRRSASLEEHDLERVPVVEDGPPRRRRSRARSCSGASPRTSRRRASPAGTSSSASSRCRRRGGGGASPAALGQLGGGERAPSRMSRSLTSSRVEPVSGRGSRATRITGAGDDHGRPLGLERRQLRAARRAGSAASRSSCARSARRAREPVAVRRARGRTARGRGRARRAS